MAMMSFGGVKEKVVTRKEFPVSKARQFMKKETIAIVGYGVQGPAQAMNLKDNGFNVIIGQRKSKKKTSSWQKAINDGWVPGKTLFEVGEAVQRATVTQLLTSDAGAIDVWPTVKENLKPGDALYFSHGFAIVFNKDTKIVPPKDVDVILCAPKGSGTSVRRNFLNGSGINSSYAVWQDATGNAEKRCIALGIGIGSGYLFHTTFENEVTSDLTGERGILMGALAGVMEAQYDTLRENGHSPSEAFNETVEELTQSLIRLVGENGMDWMYANCSTTAQRGALDWKGPFKKATLPVFKKLYNSVKTGKEARITIKANSQPDYRENLKKELDEIKNSEMWTTGAKVRELRPENASATKLTTKKAAAKKTVKKSAVKKTTAKKSAKKVSKKSAK